LNDHAQSGLLDDSRLSSVATTETDATLVDRVIREIRAAIFEGRMKPGQRISQVELAERYGTSRLPVREALRTLDQEGLVTLVPNAAARVARLEPAEFDEIYRMRARLEPLLLSESILRLSQPQLQLLRRLVDEMEAAWRGSDLHHWQELDEQFHATAYSAAPMPQLVRLIEGWWKKTRPYRRLHTLFSPDHLQMKLTEAEHRLILDAIERRDPADAERVLVIQIERTRREYANAPELFK
jgi:DNA-binding GntR family transcriptional regulator